jgi:myo-inositol-1(or 4)-monophosphatase
VSASPATANPHELLALAASLAREAGVMVRAGRARGIVETDTKSSSTDMVTEFDRASERLIVGRILDARPNDGLIGEEGASTPGTSGVTWLIDPIDGTTNFLYGLPGYAVSIAAASAEGTLAGAVYIPATDELFTATRNGGAFLDGTPIHCSTTTSLAHALVGTGFSYLAERRVAQGRRIAGILPQVRDIRRLGAAAPDLCYVAAGRLDAYFEQNLGPWDLAAGALIATEAGCRLGGYDGSPVTPAEVLAANPALFPAMVQLLADTNPGAEPGIM